MKLKLAIYKVVIGYKGKDGDTDNWCSEKVLAYDVTSAIKKIKLGREEYVAQVILENRATID